LPFPAVIAGEQNAHALEVHIQVWIR
jgi:hypothetical protein